MRFGNLYGLRLRKLGCILNIDLSHNMVGVMYLFKKK